MLLLKTDNLRPIGKSVCNVTTTEQDMYTQQSCQSRSPTTHRRM